MDCGLDCVIENKGRTVLQKQRSSVTIEGAKSRESNVLKVIFTDSYYQTKINGDIFDTRKFLLIW